MSALLITETRNTRKKTPPFRLKSDGNEFRNECRECFDHWALDENINDMCRLEMGKDDTRAQKKKATLNAINSMGSGLDRIALFCHGWPKGISFGLSIKDVPELATTIAAVSEKVVYIALFACLTGKGAFWGGSKNKKNTENRYEKIVTGREGFAMFLCSELFKLGIEAEITAHLTSGHTTRNPYKVRISPVGELITRIRMKDSKPRKDWAEWDLKLDKHPTFRFDVAMSEADNNLTLDNIRAIISDKQ